MLTMPEPEIRRYEIVSEHSGFGRSTVHIECPFCFREVVAYKWSLSGSGKKCECGALFDGRGRARGPISQDVPS